MNKLPDPSAEAVMLWLKNLKKEDLHSTGWIAINREFHGIAMAMRTYLQEHYPDPNERSAAFDGLVLGLTTVTHFDDIEKLSALFIEPTPVAQLRRQGKD